MKRLQASLQGILVLVLSFALPTGAFANINNIASATYQDAANNNYSVNSNNDQPVVIVTPPVVTVPANLTLNVGVAMTAVQVSATDAPTIYTLTNAPAGITISNTGSVSGTPAAGSESGSPYNNVIITATNSAGSGTATFSITVLGPANIVLTKTANVATAVSGNTVTFTIAYQNAGAGAASNVLITDAIPAGSTLVGGSISNGGSPTAGTITWTIGSVAAGASGSVSFQVTVN